MILAVMDADKERPLIIESDSRTVIGAVTVWRQRNEDRGYLRVKNKEAIQKLVMEIRKRKAPTWLTWVKGHAGHAGNEAADKLARRGANEGEEWVEGANMTRETKQEGIKLMEMTQRVAYRAIREVKDSKTKQRPSTDENLKAAMSQIETEYGTRMTEGDIWTSFAGKHLTKECRQFLWKAMHDGFMIGRHWLRAKMPDDLKARATCGECGVTDNMIHILFECGAVGQKQCWEQLKTAMAKAGLEWKTPSWGTLMGAPGVDLAWKLRCERVIRNEGEGFTKQEVERRWRATMNRRIQLDRGVAAIKGGRITPKNVEDIWSPVLEGRDDLPTNWVLKSGVLVGIGLD
ncbi:hypothetical protein C2E23DRAFT_811417, partial [Lenzites betulinus]